MIPLFESVLSFTDLRAFLAIAIKHKRLMVLCVCLAMCLGLVYITYKQPVYYSKSLVHVASSVPLPVDAEVVFRDSTLPSVVGQLRSPHLARRTAKQLGINLGPTGDASTYIRKLDININSEGDLVMTIWPYSLRLAFEWPEMLISEFLKYREEKRFERREQIVQSYTSEMERVRQRIEEFENVKDTFLTEEHVDDLRRTLTELSSVPAQLMIVNNKKNFMDMVQAELGDRRKNTCELLSLLSSVRQRINDIQIGSIIHILTGERSDQTSSSGQVVVTPDVLTAETKWMALERQQRRIMMDIEEASEMYLPAHQKIRQLKEQLAAVDKELDFELQVAERRFNLEYAALVSEKDSLETRYEELRELTKKNAKLQRAFEQMQAGRLSWESMYARMSRELEQIDFGADTERLDLQFMGIIDSRNHAVSPHRRKVFLYSFVFGLGLAVAVPFLLEYLDDTITFDEQVEREFKMKTIGIIPSAQPEKHGARDLSLLSGDSDHRLKEYFRVIRVNLMSNIEFSGNRQVFMVASALPKEGKSMVSLNLAASFANLGEKTLLIDADLRRGVIHRIFQVPSRPGLGQALRHEVALEQTVVNTMENNLFFMPCGRRHVHSASELLESARFENLLNSLRGQYDKIIIDTPPILGLAETSSIAKLADGVVMVIWSGNTAKKAVKTAVTTLQTNGAKFFGCILNKLDLTSATSYYYYYYYSYKYYKAYSHNPEDDPNSGVAPEDDDLIET